MVFGKTNPNVIVQYDLPGMDRDLKKQTSLSHCPLALSCGVRGVFYRLFSLGSHLCPSICEAVLLGF